MLRSMGSQRVGHDLMTELKQYEVFLRKISNSNFHSHKFLGKKKVYMLLCVCLLVVQSCLTLCNPMNCSSPGSSVHGILQATILEWVAIHFSGGSS